MPVVQRGRPEPAPSVFEALVVCCALRLATEERRCQLMIEACEHGLEPAGRLESASVVSWSACYHIASLEWKRASLE